MKSPRTTAAAFVMLVGTLFASVLVPLFDGDPATSAEWKAMVAAVVIFYGFWKSRDQAQHESDAGG